MLLRLAVVLLAVCGACAPAAPGVPSGTARVTPVPAAAPAEQPRPAAAILGSAEVRLPLLSAEDALTPAQAANEQPDAAGALPLFNSWGWVTAAGRRFGSGSASTEILVIETLRSEGATEAFAYLGAAAASAPLSAGACPASVAGLDECVLGSGGGRTVVAGRRGTLVFQLIGTGVDAARLAAVQASRLG